MIAAAGPLDSETQNIRLSNCRIRHFFKIPAFAASFFSRGGKGFLTFVSYR
jgi:hypothetical protein